MQMTNTNSIPFFNLNSRFFKNKEQHHFHLVANSQLPLVTALASMLFVLNAVFYLHLVDMISFKYFDNMGFQTA